MIRHIRSLFVVAFIATAVASLPLALADDAGVITDLKPEPGAPAGSASPSPTAPTAEPGSFDAASASYKELRARYDALKATKDGSPKKFLYAGLLAAGLKLLVDLLKAMSERLNRGKKYIPWIVTGCAVPIALLSKYALGASLFDSLLYAGAGPGAIVVHELVGRFLKKP